jgi:hypothetical protein
LSLLGAERLRRLSAAQREQSWSEGLRFPPQTAPLASLPAYSDGITAATLRQDRKDGVRSLHTRRSLCDTYSFPTCGVRSSSCSGSSYTMTERIVASRGWWTRSVVMTMLASINSVVLVAALVTTRRSAPMELYYTPVHPFQSICSSPTPCQQGKRQRVRPNLCCFVAAVSHICSE